MKNYEKPLIKEEKIYIEDIIAESNFSNEYVTDGDLL